MAISRNVLFIGIGERQRQWRDIRGNPCNTSRLGHEQSARPESQEKRPFRKRSSNELVHSLIKRNTGLEGHKEILD